MVVRPQSTAATFYLRYEKKLLFLFCIITCTHVLSAQYHDNNWIFGYGNLGNNPNAPGGGVRLHFENGYPESSKEKINFSYNAYCAVCSDSSGLLAFHTNGRQIRNRLHDLMENGDTINPGFLYENYPDGYPSISGGMTLPAPGYDNCYYLIHTSANNDLSSDIVFPIIYYSFIDMNANGGLGKVVSKNNILAEGDIPQPTGIKHGNGRDWWLLIPDYLHFGIQTFLIDPTGIHYMGDQEQNAYFLTHADNYSYCRASPDGRYFAINENLSGLWLYDFDRCSGLLSNQRRLPYQYPFYSSSLEFSADSRFLYLGTHLVVYQMDMQSVDALPYVDIDTIARYEYGASPYPPWYTHFLLPQIGPDGKIYYGTFSGTMAYHVINRPEFPLLASDFAQRGLLVPRFRNGTWCYFPNYRLGRLEGSPCDTVSARSVEDRVFQHRHWEQPATFPPAQAPRILRLPPWFHIPDSVPEPEREEEAYPLSIRAINQRLRTSSNHPVIE